MSFLYPGFLFAAFAISIPIIIHLFNLKKYKVVYFSNIAFLKNIKEETKSKAKLKNVLILIARICAILSLVLAFAQPYLENAAAKIKTNKTQVAIYLDNSFSLGLEGKFGQMLEISKNRAIGVVSAYDNSTEFLAINNAFFAKHQYFNNKEIITDHILETQTTAHKRKISEVFSKINTLYAQDQLVSKKLYLISDFQKNFCDFENLEKDSTTEIILIPQYAEKTNNIYIDSVWFEQAFHNFNQEEKLLARIYNSSDEYFKEIPANLYINDSLKTVTSFSIEPNAYQTIELVYTNTSNGNINCRLEITDYPVIFDNTFYFNYSIAEQKKVLIINEVTDNKYINTLLSADKNISVENQSVKNLQFAEFSKFDVIILCEIKDISSGLANEIHEYVSAGGTAALIPNLEANILNYNTLLSSLQSNTFVVKDTADTRISQINLNSIIYKNVFKEINDNSELPILKNYFRLNNQISKNIELLQSENSATLLSHLNYEKGNFYLFSFPIDENNGNFVKHQIFVPTIYNIVLYSGATEELYYFVNTNNLTLNNIKIQTPEYIYITKSDKKIEFIPKIISYTNNIFKIDMMDNITEAGNYMLLADGKQLKALSFNYDRQESEMLFVTQEEISENLKKQGITNFKILTATEKNIETQLQNINEATRFWKLFIILALFFILAEILIIKIL